MTVRYRISPGSTLKARVLPSVPALEISLRVSGGFIQWQRGVDGDWENLIATADLAPSALEILALLLTVDGDGSGLDADGLDGQHGAFYLDYNNFTNTPTFSSLSGEVVVVTAGGAVAVDANDGHIVINKAAPSVTPISLPPVADRDGLPLHIVDFVGNGGDITITPDGSETIMGLATWTLISGGAGLGGSITLYPNVTVGGWYA